MYTDFRLKKKKSYAKINSNGLIMIQPNRGEQAFPLRGGLSGGDWTILSSPPLAPNKGWGKYNPIQPSVQATKQALSIKLISALYWA